MDVKDLILAKIKKNGHVMAADIIQATGFSREYINRFFQELRNDGKIVLIGKSRASRYILAQKSEIEKAKKKILIFKKDYKDLQFGEEDVVFKEIKRETGIFMDVPKNIYHIVEYAFLEMLNNAIEHAQAKKIHILLERSDEDIRFVVADNGVGIFNNIQQKKQLASDREAIEFLLKGKQTTAPQTHSGQGIFFTSKLADTFTIRSEHKRLRFLNMIDDLFVDDVSRPIKGTHVSFLISLKSKTTTQDVFQEYSDEDFEFSKTKIIVNVYKMGTSVISRSEARRMLIALNEFKDIVLDFKNVETVGQGFADEVFRVWQGNHPDVTIGYEHANENVRFMIERGKH